MKWGLRIIGVACAALVLGIAVVAPTAGRGPGPAPAPTEAILAGSNSGSGMLTTRALVPVPGSVSQAASKEPGEGATLPTTPPSEAALRTERQDPNTVGETSTARD